MQLLVNSILSDIAKNSLNLECKYSQTKRNKQWKCSNYAGILGNMKCRFCV